MLNKLKNSKAAYILISVIILVILRLIIISIFPLLDKTETRYGEIARLMIETNSWIVLQIDYGIPFWAKPPLSTWLSAVSMTLFGINEFAVRFPSFLLNIGLILIVGKSIIKTKEHFWLLAFILLTTPQFYFHTGLVSTDTTLCFSVMLIMISFWKGINNEKYTIWKHLFFIGIALGLLSKGPIVLVITGPPLLLWLIINKIKISILLKRIPWISGMVLCLVITLPWYLLAEHNSPGFLNYFIIGEHFNRFLESSWTGDLYGISHKQPFGTIWLFLLLFAFPWIQIVLISLYKRRKEIISNPWVSFLFIWMIWAPIFFTISENILHTYILPSIIPMALLTVYLWKDYKSKKLALGLASIFPVLICIGLIGFLFIPSTDYVLNTDKYLLNQKTKKNLPILYYDISSYSSRFYSKGKVDEIFSSRQLDSVLDKNESVLLLVSNLNKSAIINEHLYTIKPLDSNISTTIYQIEKKRLNK